MSAEEAAFGYNALVFEHFQRPRNTPCHPAKVAAFEGHSGSLDEGVAFRLTAAVSAGRIHELRFEAYGCPYSIAAASLLTERAVGWTREDASSWSWRSLSRDLEVPSEKRGRLLILEDALRDLLKTWST